MPSTTLKYFGYSNLPMKFQRVGRQAASLAQSMESLLPDGPEKSAGMRKLLEAKDCFVRAAMDLPDTTAGSIPPMFGTPGDLMVIFRCGGVRSKEDPLGQILHDMAAPLARFNAREHLADGVPNQKLTVMTRAELDEKYPLMARV